MPEVYIGFLLTLPNCKISADSSVIYLVGCNIMCEEKKKFIDNLFIKGILVRLETRYWDEELLENKKSLATDWIFFLEMIICVQLWLKSFSIFIVGLQNWLPLKPNQRVWDLHCNQVMLPF